MRIIIVAGSKCNTFCNYNHLENDYFIGIEDGGYEIIKKGYSLDLAIGDFDTTNYFEEVNLSAKKLIKYSPIKDQIDLELALMYIEENFKDCEVYIYNATQGRMDHELITIKLLIKYQHLNIHLINHNEEILYINKSYKINKKDTRFSLIPFNEVTLDIVGAIYPLPKTTLDITCNYTSSNKTKEHAIINIYSGGIILIISE